MLHSGRQGVAIARALHVLERTEQRGATAVREVAEAKLQRLLALLAARVPHYRQVFLERGLEPRGAGVDLAQLPVLAKATVRAHPEALRAEGAGRRTLPISTGGSTGEPLRLLADVESLAWGLAAQWRGRAWAGVGVGSRGVLLAGRGQASRLGSLRLRLLGALPWRMPEGDERAARATLEVLERVRPAYVASNPSTLGFLEEAARALGRGLAVPVMFSTGELLDAGLRERLHRTFGARVFDQYGCNEVTSLAYECEQGRLHVTEEHAVLEVVDDAGRAVRDRSGRILVTDLDNLAMPLVRYEVGDVGVLSSKPCPCGRPHQVLLRLEGRMQDVLRGPGGRRLAAFDLAGVFRGLLAIRAYQLQQVALDRVELRYVGDERAAATEVAAVRRFVLERLGPSVTVAVERRDAIALTPRGKSRFVIGLPPEASERP